MICTRQTISEQFADFVYKLKYRDLGINEINYAKLLLLDYIGVVAKGNETDSAKILAKIAANKPYNTKCLIIGTNKTASPDWSAFVNGSAAHSIEMDDTYYPAPVHIGSAVYSTIISEISNLQNKISGKSFIEAVVVGYEISGRIAASQQKYAFEQGFHPTGTCNVFGCTAAISKLRNYGQQKITEALGAAGHFACGIDSFMKEGAWTKRLHPGRAAFDGLLAAELAKNNFKAEHYIFENFEEQKGFLKAYALNYDEAVIYKPFGKEFVISNCSIKPYPCCARIHSSVNALLDILAEEKILPDQIKAVNAQINTVDYKALCLPEDEKRAVKSEVDAQFSLHYALAALLVNKRLTINEYTNKFITQGDWKKYVKFVSAGPDKKMDKLYPKLWPAKVTVEMKRTEKKYFKYIENTIGTPENPLSFARVGEKFSSLTEKIYSKNRQQQIIDIISKLEAIKDISELFTIL